LIYKCGLKKSKSKYSHNNKNIQATKSILGYSFLLDAEHKPKILIFSFELHFQIEAVEIF